MRVSVKADIAELQRAFDKLSQKGVRNATVRALNKAAGNMRTEASKTVRQRRNLKAAVIKQAMRIYRATRTALSAELVATGRPIPLRDYGAKQGRAGVTVRIEPRKGRRPLVRHKGNKAFAVGKFGDHIYARETERRLPIKKLFGPSIPTALTSQAIKDAIMKVGAVAFRRRLGEELRHETRRAGLKP